VQLASAAEARLAHAAEWARGADAHKPFKRRRCNGQRRRGWHRFEPGSGCAGDLFFAEVDCAQRWADIGVDGVE